MRAEQVRDPGGGANGTPRGGLVQTRVTWRTRGGEWCEFSRQWYPPLKEIDTETGGEEEV